MVNLDATALTQTLALTFRLSEKTQWNAIISNGFRNPNIDDVGKIRESNIFKEIFIQPASGDAGVAYGACLLSTKKKIKNLKPLKNHNFYVGFRDNKNEIKKNLKINNLKFKDYKEKIYEKTSEYLEKGKIIGWYQGASEFGPRALGNRSILCKPYPEEMKDHLNINVKFTN